MDYLSLFSGAGGGDLAMQHLLGFRCRGYVEYEPYCQEVIKARIADGFLDAAPIFGDIREFNRDYANSYTGMVELITGGFPCQDISCAGGGAGINGERSGLWSEYASAICTIRPRYAFVENSPMLTIRGLGTVLRDLAAMGMDAEWCCLSASDVGAPHIRERIWILAESGIFRRSGGPCKKNLRTKVNGIIEAVGCKNREFIEVAPSHNFRVSRAWSHQPNIQRVVDGLAHQLDRLRAIGNGQVPIVAATAWDILSGGIR